MKLFQKLLIAPAVLGLFAPIAASANEINLDEVSGYASSEEVQSINEFNPKELASNNNIVDPLETELNSFEAGSFSETTTLSGSANFQIGAVQESSVTEAVTASYAYDLDLNTSFTGEDNLYVGIEAGNGPSVLNTWGGYFATENSNSQGDTLNIDSLYYSFPVGEYEIAVGPKLDSDDLMPTTTSKYSDEFFFGSRPSLESNYWAKQGTGTGIAIARYFDNGWNASGSIIATGGSTASGVLTKEGMDVYNLSLGYDGDKFGGGIIYQNSDSICNAIDSAFIADLCNQLGVSAALDEGYETTTLGAYYSPNDKTTLSATSSFISGQIKGVTVDTVSDFQIGVDHEIGNGTLSASWKTQPFWKLPDQNVAAIKSDDMGSHLELYYTYNVNDSMTIRPGFSFTMPTNTAGTLNANEDVNFYLADHTAVGVEATFKF